MTSTQAEVCKVDRRGRVHVPAARREALLDEWEGSGTSLPEFARLAGVQYATMAGWRAKRQRQRALAGPPAVQRESATPAVQLFEALVEMPGAASGAEALVIELPSGGRALVQAAAQVPWAAELLRLLAQGGGRPC
jgi:hypothetical protein